MKRRKEEEEKNQETCHWKGLDNMPEEGRRNSEEIYHRPTNKISKKSFEKIFLDRPEDLRRKVTLHYFFKLFQTLW